MQAVALKAGAGVLLALVIVLTTQLAGSEPVRKKILDELDIQVDEDATVIHISLTSPVRYIRHFPYLSGQELRIKLLLFDVSSDNRKALFGRETLVPFEASDLPLDEVVYEGDIEGGPYLTLFFSRSVDFGVQQGTDSRSIVVYVKKPAADLPCTAIEHPEKQ